MKNKKCLIFIIAIIILPSLLACSSTTDTTDADGALDEARVKIYLYGEHHGVEKIMDRELELWHKYYHEDNMRHLFIEYSYYGAEFLNLWMQSDSDDILEDLYEDWKGTAAYNPYTKEFYKKIKSECPETIFHGTDVGHQYDTTGQRFLKYLEENNLEDTEKYLLAQESIEQGKHYYKERDHAYRENQMTENFILEFDKLEGESIMGIYGGAHTNLGSKDFMTNTVPNMASQLKEYYGDIIYSEDLEWLAKDIETIRQDAITINGKYYEASYFGKEDLTGFRDYAYREFWRLENAYEDFKDNKKTGDVLPYDNYPMLVEVGQVFVIDHTKLDGTVERIYYRSDGHIWNGLESTEEFVVNLP